MTTEQVIAVLDDWQLQSERLSISPTKRVKQETGHERDRSTSGPSSTSSAA